MQEKNTTITSQQLSKVITNSMIRVGLIALIVVLCVQVFSPFLGLMIWALILAVGLYPLHLMLAKKLGGKSGRSATIIVLSGLLLIGAPTIMVGQDFVGYLQTHYQDFESGNLIIDPPSDSIADIPLIGKRVHDIWLEASQDLPELVQRAKPQLKEFSSKVLGVVASTAGSILAFLGSLIIAGIMMAYGEAGSKSMLMIFQRISNPAKGAHLQKLSVGTVRSVATGILGVAFIQALLMGVGFVFADIPGAGILAVIVLFLGVLQLPAALVSLPAIAYLWLGGDASATSNAIFTAYLLVMGLTDNVLKPLLLGRGVDAPMPVVLIGALGGMVISGIIGLFIGAVLLTMGYIIFMDWVAEEADSIEKPELATNDSE